MSSIAGRQGLRALVTRAREEADPLVQALAVRGVGTLVEPMMQIHFRDASPDLGGVRAVLCTSANGVRALARVSRERGIPLFAVGDATAARARAEGFGTVESAGGDVGDLIRLVADRLPSRHRPLLHVSGSDVAGDLVGELRVHGFTVERNVLYEARPVAALSPAAVRALGAGEIDFALFFSPRTAAIFTRLAEAAVVERGCEMVSALSISAAADAALIGLTWRERRIAARPDQPAMLGLLDQLLAERRQD
jgi:uroporphyrinogen-III synthase